MDDNFKCIYKILTAFEKSLDVEEFDIANISAGILRWKYERNCKKSL
ncbi:MAG: hypothetical protein IKO57_07215 [Treponema sp.]|nr:hypothetical protein [Treponema sp.]